MAPNLFKEIVTFSWQGNTVHQRPISLGEMYVAQIQNFYYNVFSVLHLLCLCCSLSKCTAYFLCALLFLCMFILLYVGDNFRDKK